MTLSWSHTDSDPHTTSRAAIQAAQGGAWESLDATTRARYLRMLMVLSLQAGTMTLRPPRPRGAEAPVEYGFYQPGQFRDQQSLEIASVILRTPQLVLLPGSYVVTNATTTDGGQAVLEGDEQHVEVGAVPILIWVLGVTACAIASIVVAQTAGEVIDRQLTRSEDTKRLLGAQGHAVDVLHNHADREDKAGKAIPFTEIETAVIDSLLKTQTQIANKRQTPLPSPFAGAAETLGNAAKTIKEGIVDIAPWALAAGVAYWFFTSKRSNAEE